MKNPGEEQYLKIISKVIETGDVRIDRTNVGTKCLFGEQMIFNLADGFPLLTTKKVPWKCIVGELLWFISGSTNAKVLDTQGIKIWNKNATAFRNLQESSGVTINEGDLGPIYGKQWRNFGGIDQLQELIDSLQNIISTGIDNRRLIISSWNPPEIPMMALPPCHMIVQFDLNLKENCGVLSSKLTQRSADLGLGVPFNIASYALLTHIIARVISKPEYPILPGIFIHDMGNTHVYLNHETQLKEQILRKPRPFPNLKIKEGKKDINNFVIEDFILENYNPHPAIKMDMAV
ncbi:thymidylate synthase [Armadillidium vulgare iridescent virus]|uniref:thymidylate synthase n=1 Tax=Armadillidium vulgare iridescent virus TaxID=72201 RepID=A0A068QL47_9VIRU|nr:thymidylate synthase [Armadillidium vulgare iridescent virus]CCV02485.1 Thymidylate synthetase [Armadillidium vulgare iridescent virus]